MIGQQLVQQAVESSMTQPQASNRRSSAARELYLTKYYFYRRRADDVDNADTDAAADENAYHQSAQVTSARCVSQLEGARRQQPRCVACQRAQGEAHELLEACRRLQQPTSGYCCSSAWLTSAQIATTGIPTAQQQAANNQSDNCSLVSASTATTISPSNSTSQQHTCEQLTCTSASNAAPVSTSGCSTQISSASNNSSSDAQQQSLAGQRQHLHLSHQLSYPAPNRNLRPSRRRNSSPNSEDQQPSIEEQLKRLLEIDPDRVSTQQGARTSGSTPASRRDTSAHSGTGTPAVLAGGMKKSSGKLGGGRDDANRNQQQRQKQQDSGISPDDRLMIFMLASRSSSTNSTVERNARILKWLNNCKNAS